MRDRTDNLAKLIEVFLTFLIVKFKLQRRGSYLVLNLRSAPAVTRFSDICDVDLGSVDKITLIMMISFSTNASNGSAIDCVTLIDLV